jgi:regulator of PEP synthase PpsR (kinase-PPPase family)
VDCRFHIHLVSDSTGETLHAVATAALAQFENVDVRVHPYALVRSDHQLTRALDHVAINPGIVFFTLANQGLRDRLMLRCLERCVISWARRKATRSAASTRWTSSISNASKC